MNTAGLLTDAFTRVRESVRRAVTGLSAEELAYRADAEANSIAWLVWHLTRVQDDHVAEVAGTEQVWTSGDWRSRFDLSLPAADTGYGHSAAQVAAVRVGDPELLIGYHDAVCEQTLRYVGGLADADLDHVVDDNWDPPVTLGVRLVSVICDDLEHVGQAAFLRGIVRRR
ncbi:MAG TPA: DUF664 domain-containing protein [Streptosporangiaceae bacterium]|jgi:hypothetical protein